MSHPSKAKGDKAELELAKLLSDRLGIDCRRMLGAGRQDDVGDLHGLDGWTVEAKNYADLSAAIRDGLADLDREQANAGTPHGVVFVRRRGGRWIAVMDLDRWCGVYGAVQADRHAEDCDLDADCSCGVAS